MTIRQWVQWGKQQLEQQEIEDAAQDSWYLFEFATGLSRMDYLLDGETEWDDSKAERYKQLIEQRKQHIPLQHLTGVQQFMGYEFCVNSSVLIPRQDTETLVEEVLSVTKGCKKVLDLCTGSGCIALSLALLGTYEEVIATDLSKDALEVAKQNKKRLFSPECETVSFYLGDLWEAVPEGKKFDVIVSNPPYIETEVCKTLMPEVRDHEPRMALDGRKDGLYFYRAIIEQAGDYLEDGGWLFFEIGYNQGEALRQLLEEKRTFEQIQIKKDLAGLDRIVSARYKKGKKTRELSLEET